MRGFGHILLTGGVLGAALSCYLVSLQVASERAELERIEHEIALVTRDIRELETEIGTRGRLSQLEKWNAGFLDLKAPAAGQFLDGGFQLATLMKPEEKPVLEAPVILAAAPKPEEEDELTGPSLDELVTAASYRAAPKPKAPADPLAPLPEAAARDGFAFITPGEDSTNR